MRCPQCLEAMTSFKPLQGAQGEFCTGCKNTWFSQASFEKILRTPTAMFLRQFHKPIPSQRKKCCSCLLGHLEEHSMMDKTTKIFICNQCSGVTFQSGLLSKLLIFTQASYQEAPNTKHQQPITKQGQVAKSPTHAHSPNTPNSHQPLELPRPRAGIIQKTFAAIIGISLGVMLLFTMLRGSNVLTDRAAQNIHRATLISDTVSLKSWLRLFSANIRNEVGQTPLMIAAENGDGKMVAFLMNQGGRLNLTDKKGETALFYALKQGHPNLARYLIKNGANIHLKSNMGLTAQHLMKAQAPKKKVLSW